jgi:hypothetical protein
MLSVFIFHIFRTNYMDSMFLDTSNDLSLKIINRNILLVEKNNEKLKTVKRLKKFINFICSSFTLNLF